MPIMVTHHSSPKVQDVIASSQPKINTQRIFSKKLPTLLEKSTSLPKGQNINEYKRSKLETLYSDRNGNNSTAAYYAYNPPQRRENQSSKHKP